MTGVRFEEVFDDRAITAALSGLMAAARNTEPMMRAIGIGLREGVQTRIEREGSPDGTAFKPLLPAYALIKRGPGILRAAGMSGGLTGSLTLDATPGSVTVGTNKIYGAIHQFGGVIRPVHGTTLAFFLGRASAPGPRGGKRAPGKALVRVQSVTIPARPYLGLSESDRAHALEQAEIYIGKPLAA